MEQQTGSKLGKEYIKAVYCHSAYLTYMQSISWEMPGWMKHKLESRLPGEISVTTDMQMTPPLWQKGKRNLQRGRGTRDQIANIHWIIAKAREFQKIIYFCFIDYAKVFDCVDHNKLWKILKEMGIPGHLTYLLRNLYAGQEQQLEPDGEN